MAAGVCVVSFIYFSEILRRLGGRKHFATLEPRGTGLSSDLRDARAMEQAKAR